MGSRHKARIIAFQGIFSWDMNHRSAEDLNAFEWIEESNQNPVNQQFAALLVSGTIEHAEEIDLLIKNNIKHWDFNRLSRIDLAILRISVYSLKYQSDIPHSVTIDEAINLAKEFGNDDSYRFINGVLDGIKKNL